MTELWYINDDGDAVRMMDGTLVFGEVEDDE